MGGAERAERKRRQQAAQTARAAPAAAAPAQEGGRSRTLVAAGAVLGLIVFVVIGGILLQNRGDAELPAAIPVVEPPTDYPVEVRDDVVVAGDGPVTIDVYEDFLCPICGDFEEAYGDELEQAAASGRATVRYHPVAILDGLSDPEGYSTLAAATAFCAADAGVFSTVHESLFATQPDEGGSAWTRAQLVSLGRELGAGEGFGRCVDGEGAQRVESATRQGMQEASGPNGFGTPAVLVNGQAADIGDGDWLENALSGR